MKPVIIILGVLFFAFLVSHLEEKRTGSLSPQPTTPPSVPNIIPGIAPVDLYGNLENKGFNIQKDFSGTQVGYSCLKSNANGTLAAIARAAPGHTTKVAAIEASAESIGRTGQEFLGFICTLKYEGAQPEKARAWLDAHFGTNATTTIGQVRFTLTRRNATNHSLSIVPANISTTRPLPAVEGWTMDEVKSRHGPPLSTDKTTGLATWPTFTARFERGAVQEVRAP